MNSTFSDNLAELDTLTSVKPNVASLRRFTELAQDSVLYQYAFDNLSNPEWLTSLAQAGFFKIPPSAVRDDVQGTVAFPVWVESRCLLRLVENAPDQVLEIALNLPDTDNIRVHNDILETTLKLPNALGIQIAPLAKNWAEALYGILSPETFGKYLVYLSEGDKGDEALDIASSLLRIVPDPRTSTENTVSEYAPAPEPRSWIASWWYSDILEKYIPVLTKEVGLPVLSLLCNKLDEAIRLSLRAQEELEGEDYSYIWMPNLDSEGDVYSHSVKSLLLRAVVNTARQIIREKRVVNAVLELLDSRPWFVYRRLTMLLLASTRTGFNERISEILTDKSNFDSFATHREYKKLLSAKFKTLMPIKQNTVLGWIEAGPDPRIMNQKFSEDAIPEAIRGWKYKWLFLISRNLPPVWKSMYKQLEASLKGTYYENPQQERSFDMVEL